MSLVKQSTLLNHHGAIEESVDIDRVWQDLQVLFEDHEQQEIQEQPTKSLQMQKLLDLLVNKDDEAFDVLVDSLQNDYEWLALRLQRGTRDEERRVNKLGKGIRRKIALAMLTARISERQKDYILERVTSVVNEEITQKVSRVNVPDHRAAAQLDREHRLVKDLIRYEIDPILYGEEPSQSGRTYQDNDDVLAALQSKLEELRELQRCYAAMNLGTVSTPTLPSLLLEKIEEVKLRIRTLQKEKQEAMEESQSLSLSLKEQQRSLSRLEQHNRNLELENNNLDTERQQLENSARKLQEEKKEAEKNWQRATEENRDMASEIQQANNKLSSLTIHSKSLDCHNSKLLRDNIKLSAANSHLRKEARNNGTHILVAVRSENKRLATERMQIKRDLHRVESERRQQAIRSQKLEIENRHLRDQKLRLTKDKRKNKAENQALKVEAQRLALGKYSPLPAIGESGEDLNYDDVSHRSLALSMTSQSRHGGPRRVRHPDGYVARYDPKTQTPWNKYKGDGREKRPRKDKTDNNPRDGEEEGKGEEEGGDDVEGRRKPGYLKPTNSSKGHEYMED
ncbi:hypothetical protein ACOMHN_034384 [Nucella lapillus]